MISNLPQATNYYGIYIIAPLVLNWMSVPCIDGASIKSGSILTDHIHYSPVTNDNDGVPIDFNNYSANSSSDVSILPSAPGCPKPNQGLPWIYYGNPPKCYLIGTRGPCLPGHIFFGNGTISPLWGHCDCPCSPLNRMTGERSSGFLYFDMHVSDFPNYLFCKIKDVPELNHVTAVYDKQMEMCYFLNTQGPCQVDEWLVRMNTGIEQTTGNIACVPKCTSETEAGGPFHSSNFYDSRDNVCKMNPNASTIQPVSLTTSLGQQGCSGEDGMIYSKTLKKCIPKSKAFFIKFI